MELLEGEVLSTEGGGSVDDGLQSGPQVLELGLLNVSNDHLGVLRGLFDGVVQKNGDWFWPTAQAELAASNCAQLERGSVKATRLHGDGSRNESGDESAGEHFRKLKLQEIEMKKE
ncbi:hypothetical protein PM082_012676 [Marasmius tenuissimus]|nr:hypothetical protein PM082_012676 [Marasmius tenuissimus]